MPVTWFTVIIGFSIHECRFPGRQRRPADGERGRALDAGGNRVVGHRLRQGPVPRRVHARHRLPAVDTEELQVAAHP